ncbi:hypothetical protein H5410_029391 [Solanum commersonii]|uniref:Uncharacterized protein n=1 Tax=Solanum commersonii TaxID=4109 RepID=A0A9J5Z4I7_SOLCO|nr:hypothetical protein H5410_029391 [Solanum commersonii]
MDMLIRERGGLWGRDDKVGGGCGVHCCVIVAVCGGDEEEEMVVEIGNGIKREGGGNNGKGSNMPSNFQKRLIYAIR